jgi:starch synthase
MEILFVASEVAPFSKTGGLGDVAEALPRALAARGHAVTVATPLYGSIDPRAHGLRRVDATVDARGEGAGLWVAPGEPAIHFLEHDRYFGQRRGLYGEAGADYGDNAQRFAFLARAALALPRALSLEPAIVHLNDWQTALAAWMLRHEYADDPHLARARSVFTIHNLAYQGIFEKEMLVEIGLPWEVFSWEAMEFHDRLNFMKAGLTYADALTTVSPTYAREVLTPEHGYGLDALLRHRRGQFHGILNGIDTAQWDPARDTHLPARYGPRSMEGKAACKAALQRELGLPERPDVPLVGMVGRLAEQKGIDLVAAALPAILGTDLQLALLGSGQSEYQDLFRRTALERPERVGVRIGFDEGLAHRIEAGADIFLMPSRYEPCGLNQMYSLRYGTVPVVRAVGGLEDTVEDFDGLRRGTGFKFREYDPRALLTALRRAVEMRRDARAWRGIVERGMAMDFSWDRSASRYEELFRTLAER